MPSVSLYMYTDNEGIQCLVLLYLSCNDLITVSLNTGIGGTVELTLSVYLSCVIEPNRNT